MVVRSAAVGWPLLLLPVRRWTLAVAELSLRRPTTPTTALLLRRVALAALLLRRVALTILLLLRWALRVIVRRRCRRRVPRTGLWGRAIAQVRIRLATCRRARLGVVAVSEASVAALRAGRLAHVALLRLPVNTLHGAEVPRLHGAPQRPADLSVADAAESTGPRAPLTRAGVAVVAGLLVRADNVVLAGFNALRREKTVNLVSAWVAVGPFADGLKHVLLDLDVLVADCWVVEGAEHVVDHFVDRDAGIFPGVEYAAGDVVSQ